MKTCKTCGVEKGYDNFSRHSTRDGYRHQCKSCRSVREKARYDYISVKDKRLQREYGISLDDLDLMRQGQDYRCLICDIHEEDARHSMGTGLVVDHCHDSGRVRGLLCAHCNTAIGLLRDNPLYAIRASEYLIATGDSEDGK